MQTGSAHREVAGRSRGASAETLRAPSPQQLDGSTNSSANCAACTHPQMPSSPTGSRSRGAQRWLPTPPPPAQKGRRSRPGHKATGLAEQSGGSLPCIVPPKLQAQMAQAALPHRAERLPPRCGRLAGTTPGPQGDQCSTLHPPWRRAVAQGRLHSAAKRMSSARSTNKAAPRPNKG